MAVADPSNEARDPGSAPANSPAPIIVALVNQALDDLEVERFEVADALRLVAEHAWAAGYHAGLVVTTGANGQHPLTGDAAPDRPPRLRA
jgi:hypothetical protein